MVGGLETDLRVLPRTENYRHCRVSLKNTGWQDFTTPILMRAQPQIVRIAICGPMHKIWRAASSSAPRPQPRVGCSSSRRSNSLVAFGPVCALGAGIWLRALPLTVFHAQLSRRKFRRRMAHIGAAGARSPRSPNTTSRCHSGAAGGPRCSRKIHRSRVVPLPSSAILQGSTEKRITGWWAGIALG